MKYVRQILLPLLLAALTLLVVRGFLLTHMQLPRRDVPSSLQAGAHVLVSLTYYGLRVPGEQLWGYHRWGERTPAVGDALVFTNEKGENVAGICRAIAGDTVWIDTLRHRVLPARTSPDATPHAIPKRHYWIETSKDAHTLVFHEQLVGKIVYTFNLKRK